MEVAEYGICKLNNVKNGLIQDYFSWVNPIFCINIYKSYKFYSGSRGGLKNPKVGLGGSGQK